MKIKKESLNKIFSIYSLILPFAFFVLLFIAENFGAVAQDIYTASPSNSRIIIKNIVLIIYVILIILEFVLFRFSKLNNFNLDVCVMNIFQCLCFAFYPLGGWYLFWFGGFILYFPFFIISVKLWCSLLEKLRKNTDLACENEQNKASKVFILINYFLLCFAVFALMYCVFCTNAIGLLS